MIRKFVKKLNDRLNPPKDIQTFGPLHESAGEESPQEKADDIRAWLDEVESPKRDANGLENQDQRDAMMSATLDI